MKTFIFLFFTSFAVSLATGGHEGIDLLTSLGLLGNHDNGAMYCPGNCPSSNKALCMSNGNLCSHGQYCHVFMDKTHTIHGRCTTNLLHTKCVADKTALPCSVGVFFRDSCIMSCCQNTQCLSNSNNGGFPDAGASTTSAPATSTTAPPSTAAATTAAPAPAVTTAQSLYAKFKNGCKDHLEAGVCSTLQVNEDICHKQISVDLCPMTCGICKVISDANCHDTILDNGCHDQYVSKGICGDPLAKYTCPDSCGMCDVIVSQKIQDHINQRPSTTHAAPTTTEEPTFMPQDSLSDM